MDFRRRPSQARRMSDATTKIFHDADADPAALAGKTVAVIGYGNQGRSQALNVRDGGLTTIVGNLEDAYAAQARADGFTVLPIAEACARADVVMLLVPDEVMPAVYAESVHPHLSAGKVLDFASGYTVAFGLIVPPRDVDVILIAPRMIGPGVRDTYVAGSGFPSFVALQQDASGVGMARLLALAHAVGSTRAGCILMSMHDEATLDLFTEQAFGPAFGRVFMAAIETLVGAGYPPEAVLLELYLSGELAYSFEKIRQVGMMRQMDFHSHTSQYGSLTRSARFADVDLETRMATVLREIQDGTFAREWSGAGPEAAAMLERVKTIRDQLPLTQWEARAREAFRIGDAAPPAVPRPRAAS
jgi:ketol-acid reductoisomerase